MSAPESEPNTQARFRGAEWLLVAWIAGCGLLYAQTVLDARAPGWRDALRSLWP